MTVRTPNNDVVDAVTRSVMLVRTGRIATEMLVFDEESSNGMKLVDVVAFATRTEN